MRPCPDLKRLPPFRLRVRILAALLLAGVLASGLTAAFSPAQAAGRTTTDLTGSEPTVSAIVKGLAPTAPMSKELTPDANLIGKDIGIVERSVALNVPFSNNSAAISPQAAQILTILAQALNSPELSGRRVRIEGHANLTGAAEYNQQLTSNRAIAVAAFLVTRMVQPGRMDTAGFGFNRPLTGLDPRDGRNRRVEIVTLPGGGR